MTIVSVRHHGPELRLTADEYVVAWSGRRYVVNAVHRRALILDEPLRLTATFEDLQRP